MNYLLWASEGVSTSIVGNLSISDCVALFGVFVVLVGWALHFLGSRRNVQMKLISVNLVQIYEDTCVFLFHLSFLNNASVKRVVDDIDLKDKLYSPILNKADYKPDLCHRTLIYQLPNGEEMTIPIDVLLLSPFDISPLQCLDKWHYLQIECPLGNQEKQQKVEMRLEIHNRAGDEIDFCDVVIWVDPIKKASTFETPPNYKSNRFSFDFMYEPSFTYFLLFIILFIFILSILHK
jgi:hypothetical protein